MSSIWIIRRSATDIKLTGLCGGVARHWGVDPLLVRIGCALLALSGGIGIVLYVAGWLLIPVEGQDKRPVDDLLGGQVARWSNQAWIAIVAVACVVAFALLGSLMPFGFGPAVILAAVWYFGYYRNRARTSDSVPPPNAVAPYAPYGPPAPYPPPAQYGPPTQYGPPAQSYGPDPAQHHPSFQGPPTPFTQAAQAWQQRVAEQQQSASSPSDGPVTPGSGGAAPYPTAPAERTWEPTGPASTLPLVAQPFPGAVPLAQVDPRAAFLAQPDPMGLYVEAAPEPVVARHRTRSARRLRWVGLLVMGLALSGLAAADRLGANVPVSGYLAAALLVVGLTLVAATWFGRARGLLPLGALLLVSVLATSIAGPVASMEGWGSERLVYTSVTELPTTPIMKDVGQIEIDLSQVPLTQDTLLTAHVDAGSLVVTVPENTNVRIQYVIDAGVLTSFGDEAAAGTDLRNTIEPVDANPTDPTLTLVLSVDVGEIRVQR